MERLSKATSWLGCWVFSLLALTGAAAVLGFYTRVLASAFRLGWRMLQ